MKKLSSPIAALIILIIVAGLCGCVTGIRSVKPTEEDSSSKAQEKSTSEDKSSEAQARDEGGQGSASGGPTLTSGGTDDTKQPTSTSTTTTGTEPSPPVMTEEKTKKASIDLRQKEEVNQAALKFAKNVPGVKHIKTCYSRLYGGWYLLLYRDQDNKTSLQQYAWNDGTKEWEIIYQLKELPPKQLEFHLKGEVSDEKCFILK